MRAQRTAEIIIKHNKISQDIPTYKDERLNERHYGSLQGLNKTETAEKYGAEQVHIWRRSFDILLCLIIISAVLWALISALV